MNIDDIEKLINGNPRKLIEEGEKLGIDWNGLDKDISKKLVKERINLTDEQFQAVDFVFWIAYLIEKEAENLIIYPEVGAGARQIAMEMIINKLCFGDKIKIIEELYANKKDKFIKLMRKIQNLRNDVAHGRFDNLKYEDYYLSDNRGKLILIADLRDAALNKE